MLREYVPLMERASKTRTRLNVSDLIRLTPLKTEFNNQSKSDETNQFLL